MNRVANIIVLLSDGPDGLDRNWMIGALQSSCSIRIVNISANNPHFWTEGNTLSLTVTKAPSRSIGGFDPKPILAI